MDPLRKMPYGAALVGVVLLAVGLLLAATSRAQERTTQAELVADAGGAASAFQSYLDRARGLDLLLAQSPAFRTALRSPDELRAAQDALAYLEVLYPDAIGEACLIDERGHELARLVDAEAADDLSGSELDNDFVTRTFAQPEGRVYQAPPYVSEDTGAWVISNSTWIAHPDGRRLIVHFEVSLESFRPYVEVLSEGRPAAIVDRGSGAVLLQAGVSLPGPGLPLPTPAWAGGVAQADDAGATVVLGRPAGAALVDRSPGSAPDWVAVTWSAGRTSTVPPWLGVAAAVVGVLLVLLALWQLRRQQSALRAVARLDHLAGLANRKALEESLEQALAAAPDEGRVGVLLIDLDGFKQVNDSLGHERGDLVLREVARRLHANVLEHDTAARLGGDEFAVVLRRLQDADDGAGGREPAPREALVRPVVIDGVPHLVGASIGASTWPEHGTSGLELLRGADAAMYQAKRGRQGVCVYEPGTSTGATDLGLAAQLLAAIEAGELTLAFQPEFASATGEVCGVEALARWNPSGGEPVPPDVFVTLAEQTGLIRPLTSLTLRLALDAAVTWRQAGCGVPVSVNISGLVVGDPTLLDEVRGLLDERDLPPGALVLELTETAAVHDSRAAIAVMTALRDLGVRVHLDDFGSGYASFRAVRDLPLDAVKVDRALVQAQVAGDARLLAATIELAHSLTLEVVAEGIEDVEALGVVTRLGCDGVQGYHLARPMPSDALLTLLRAQPARVRA